MPPSQYIVQFDRGDMQSMCIAQELGAKRSEIIEFSRMQCMQVCARQAPRSATEGCYNLKHT